MALPRTPLRMALACGTWCAFAACGDAAIQVTVELDGGGTQCLRVVASPTKIDGGSQSTGLIPVADRSSFAVIVFSGPLAKGATVVAEGYDTPGCEQLNEETAAAPLDFHTRAPVTLTLSGSVCRGIAVGGACPGGHCRPDGGCIDAGELDCGDALDDDGNGLFDCSDPACLGQHCVADPCNLGDLCQADAGCAGGIASGSCIAFDYAPSNFNPVAVGASGVAPPIALACSAAFDTTTLTTSGWCAGQPPPAVSLVTPPGGPQVAVLKMQALSISPGNTLTLTGTRPAILAVWGDVNIEGSISARSALGGMVGPGANFAGCGGPTGGAAIRDGGGGGGAGGTFALGGGAGGGFTNALGGSGGLPAPANGTAALVPLRGGCQGGDGARGNDPAMAGSHGGNSGGAVQVSAAGELKLAGGIYASGAGAQQGLPSFNGGGGGGSGGGILLEGKRIVNTGTLTANGGSGAEGSGANVQGGAPGTDGALTTAAPAVMSTPLSANGGNGGNGAAGSTPAAVGETGITSGGGGGGDVGRIRINAADGGCSILGGLRSPQATGGGSCPLIIP